MTNEFLPVVAEALSSAEFAVHLMPTDSHRESLFLCTRVFAALSSQCSIKEMQLDPLDPTLGWESLFGKPDSSPVIHTRHECHVLVIKDGNLLPYWFVDLHLDYLRDLAQCFRVHMLLPVSRPVGAQIANEFKAFHVPSLRDATATDLRDLIHHLVNKMVPDLRDTGSVERQASRDEMCELILSANPASRSHIEDSLEWYSKNFDPEIHKSVLDIAHKISPDMVGKRVREPSPVLSQNALNCLTLPMREVATHILTFIPGTMAQ